MKFATLYKHDRSRSQSFATINREESMTQKSDALDTDINVIMQRFGQTGQLPQVQMDALYADFTQVGDYRDAVERIKAAETAFAQIPAKIRREFDNNPQAFIDFITDDKNAAKVKEWGLTNPEKPRETTLDDINNTLKAGFTPKDDKNDKT